MREALDSPLPVSGLTMQVFAAPFKGTAPKASVLLGVEMRGPRSEARRRRQAGALVSARSTRRASIRAASNDTVTLNLRPETRARVEQTGLRMLSRFELPPGRYQLRVAADELATKPVGSVLYDLDVPDFSKGAAVDERRGR